VVLHFCVGLIKSIGVSNYTRDHLEEMMQYCCVKPAVLQVMYQFNTIVNMFIHNKQTVKTKK